MGKLFAAMYDPMMKPLEPFLMSNVRRRLIGSAYGRVLEIGSGSGLNFKYYTTQAEHITAVEPDQKMRERSLPKMLKAKNMFDVMEGDAEQLPFEDNTFDTVVSTLVFCTIPDPEKAMDEVVRVLKPGGIVLLYEHVQGKHSLVQKAFNTATPIWKRVAAGCHLNRDTEALIHQRPLKIVRKHTYAGSVLIEITAKLSETE